MSEEVVENTQEPVAEEQPEAASAETKNTAGEDDPRIPKSRFDQVNEERKKLKKELDDLRRAQAELEEQAQAEQGKYRDLYEKTKAKLKEQEGAFSALEFDIVRREVAAEAGYPALWSRLQGGNREELEADLGKLLEAMPRPSAPSLNGAAGTGERKAPADQITLEDKKEFAAVMGLRVEDIPEL